MPFVSDIYKSAPATFRTPLQAKTYQTLRTLDIPFERVDTGEAITMEDCIVINDRLKTNIVKTLFLCNPQQSVFYLFVTAGDKPFRSRDFSAALDVTRVSFAPVELMEPMLGTKIGAATVFSALFDVGNAVRIVFDRDVLLREWYGCSDGTTTGYMKVKTDRITDDFLSYAGHKPTVIEV